MEWILKIDKQHIKRCVVGDKTNLILKNNKVNKKY
jgi:hypothetical protein